MCILGDADVRVGAPEQRRETTEQEKPMCNRAKNVSPLSRAVYRRPLILTFGLRSSLEIIASGTICDTRHAAGNSPYFSTVESDGQQAATNGDCDRMRPVICTQFIHQVLDMKVDGGFRYVQLVRNLFVAMAVTYQAEYFQFANGKVLFTHVFRDASSHLVRNVPLPRVN